MSEHYVRETGRVEDMDGSALVVGVDFDSVVIGRSPGAIWRFTQAQAEEFAQLFVSACWQAGQQRARMAGECGDPAADEEGGCICGRTAAVCAQAGREGSRG